MKHIGKEEAGMANAADDLFAEEDDENEEAAIATNKPEGGRDVAPPTVPTTPKPDDAKGVANTAMVVFLNYLKIEVERLARWLVDRGYHTPLGRDLLAGINGIFGEKTGTALDMIASVINVPDSAKKWLVQKAGVTAGDKVGDIIDEFIDELFEQLRTIWAANGQNLPPAELAKLQQKRTTNPILGFSSAFLELEPSARTRLGELLASLTPTGEPTEKQRFAFYRPRLNSPRALITLLDVAEFNPSFEQWTNGRILLELEDRRGVDVIAALDPAEITDATLRDVLVHGRAFRALCALAKKRMFAHLALVYGEYAESAMKRYGKRAAAFFAEKVGVVYGDPATELPQVTAAINDHALRMAAHRATIRERRRARK
ncbi:MAG: hypothetical protein AAB879_02145 [Patescibacteria group bacterium]